MDAIEINPAEPARGHLPSLGRPAVSTSTKPTRRFASPTCRAAWWWNVRINAPSTRTARGPWRFCSRASWKPRRKKQRQQEASTRKSLVGSGDRSERIRTYNFPQGRVTDHRINLTLYKLDDVLAGNLDPVINPLSAEHRAGLLAEACGTAGYLRKGFGVGDDRGVVVPGARASRWQ